MIDFQEAYGWLYQFDKVDSYLSESAKLFKIPIEQALTNKDFSNLDRLVNQILRIAQTSAKIWEIAEIKLLCARAYYVQAEMGKTLQMLDEASILYKSDPHKYAVVQWMKGCAYWKMGDKQPEALHFWQVALDIFDDKIFQNRANQQASGWYQAQCKKMRQSFQEVII